MFGSVVSALATPTDAALPPTGDFNTPIEHHGYRIDDLGKRSDGQSSTEL